MQRNWFILLVIALPFWLHAASLTLTEGEIKTHTEVFGDSNINPSSKIVTANISMNENIESLKGKFSIKVRDLKSTKTDRDEHMYEALEANSYPDIFVDITGVTKIEQAYKLNGTVTLHGITKPLDTVANIEKTDNTLSLKGSFSVSMKEHGIKPIKLLFLTVRDRVDITYNLRLK